MTGNPYSRLGLVLVLAGAVSAPIFYFVVSSVPLAALGLSSIILGLVSAMLGSARPQVSPEAARMMLQTGVENIASLLEELGLEARAVYLPSGRAGEHPKALIPLRQNGAIPGMMERLPNRLIARYGQDPEDVCLVVTTPGAVSMEGVAVAQGADPGQIEHILTEILVGMMDLADSVKAHVTPDRVLVEVANPRLKNENIWFYRCLGSPLASIAATVSGQALGQAVRIAKEEDTRKGTRVEIEVLP